jgi:hypothetical protein
VQGLQELLMAVWSGFTKAQNKAAEMSVRCINSNVCKDSYNEAIENGYTTSEASLLELWFARKATTLPFIS